MNPVNLTKPLPQVWRTPPSLRATGRLNAEFTTAKNNHTAPPAGSVPAAGERGHAGSTAAWHRSAQPLLSCHRICSSLSTRRHKIRFVSARLEFLGGTGVAVLLQKFRFRPCLDPQPLQPRTPSLAPRHFPTDPNRRPGRVESICNLRGIYCRTSPVRSCTHKPAAKF